MHAYLNQETGLIDLFDVDPIESITQEQYKQRKIHQQKLAERAQLIARLEALDKELESLVGEPAQELTKEPTIADAQPQVPQKIRKW